MQSTSIKILNHESNEMDLREMEVEVGMGKRDGGGGTNGRERKNY